MMFSVILAVCKVREKVERQRNFNFCIRQWFEQTYDDYEIIIVDQIVDEKLGSFVESCEVKLEKFAYYKVYDPDFRRGWLLNYGAKRSHGDVLICIDGDVVFGTDYLSNMYDQFYNDYLFGFGFDRLIKLNKKGYNKFYSDYFDNQDNYDEIQNWPKEYISSDATSNVYTFAGSANIFEREFYFNKIYGWNETYTWGGGGCRDILLRACSAAKIDHKEVPRFKYTLYHLWHPDKIFAPDFRELMSFTKENPELVIKEIAKLGIGGDEPAGYDLDKLKEKIQ